MAYELHTIAATALVPAPEAEQGSDFLSGTAGLGKLVHFRNTWLSVCCSHQLFFSFDLGIHVVSFHLDRSIANSRFREASRIENASRLVIGFSH